MTHPRWRLILNGKSAGDEDLREAVHVMRSRGIELGVRVTWEGGDADRYVAEAIDDRIDVLLAAGGDGTLSEVVSALAHGERDASSLPSLALVPMGTANDFATATGVPLDPLPAMELAASRPAHAIDVLRIDAGGQVHWCANLASGGFGTRITVETNEGLKKMLGGLAYVLTGLSKLGRIEPVQAAFRGPDFAWQGDFIALGIGNGRQAGGGQALCPDALLDDGLLDLTVVPPLEGEVAATLRAVLSEGKDAALDRIATRARLPWVEIESTEPLSLNLDGEPVEATRFRIECVPKRVRMHLPVDCPLLA
ncbi:lipid kinase YegS [Luteimonas aestuarii]|uniref:Probable lipid kinase YegS-like n=1 Tax=Luteimonas aestuarii TaxID=453837 RepID=A0A4R5TTL5_9GAMM|nr:lipid kinase YegS [Luteimonas aestuarii]TDK24311.1 lipid kinase YegS [Luteimonas aestuarii]